MYADLEVVEQFKAQDECPYCGGQGHALGTFGYLLHLRCRDCGMDFSVPSPDLGEEREEF